MKTFCAIPLVLCFAAPAGADLMLFARYEWQDGAADTSGSPMRHDGVLDPMATASGGTLAVDRWDGVYLGSMPELAGATQVLLRFENVTFTKHQESDSGAVCHAAVLAGCDMQWSAGAFFDLPPYGNRTTLTFSLVDYDKSLGLAAVVADEIVDHFDSIEYRLDGTLPVSQRLAIRWNDGPWVIGGESTNPLDRMPSADQVRINNGGPADEDPMWGSLGTVSFYSNQIPEPSTCALLLAGALCLAAFHGRRRWPNM
jgi:hypothetical protein